MIYKNKKQGRWRKQPSDGLLPIHHFFINLIKISALRSVYCWLAATRAVVSVFIPERFRRSTKTFRQFFMLNIQLKAGTFVDGISGLAAPQRHGWRCCAEIEFSLHSTLTGMMQMRLVRGIGVSSQVELVQWEVPGNGKSFYSEIELKVNLCKRSGPHIPPIYHPVRAAVASVCIKRSF